MTEKKRREEKRGVEDSYKRMNEAHLNMFN